LIVNSVFSYVEGGGGVVVVVDVLVNLKFAILQDLMPLSLINQSRRFEGKCSLHVGRSHIPPIKAKS
jgi:hypothetical protein